MACVTLIPGNSDRNDGIVEELRARPGASSQPTAPAKPSAPRLLRGSRKMVTVKVEPSYVSSDLFTPFSEPRSTLPSIGEFVRPSYGSARTWGTVTSSYGGVGSACQLFKRRGQGSISRSHQHYGSGCINYSTHEDDLDLRRPAYKHESVTLRAAASPRQCERASSITATKNAVPVSVNTASALKTVCGALYGTSSYNNDFASTLNTPSPPQRYHPSTTQPMPIHRGSLTTDIADTSSIPTRQKWNNTIQSPKNEESCGKRKLCTEADNHLEKNEEDEDEDLDESGEEESGHSDDPEVAVSASNITSTTHGHMISLSHCTNVLPSHMIVTSLSELPSHFRRVTTKYTRYRCPLFPCRVPHYLVRKHQLLPSVITTLPLRMKSGPQLPAMTTDGSLLPAKDLAMRIYRPSVSDSGDTSATSKDRQMSSTTIKDAAVNCHTNFNGYSNIVNDANKGDVDNHLPDLVNDLDAGRLRMDEKGSGAKSHQNGAHYHQHQRHHEHRYHWSVRSKAATRDRVIVRDTTMQECVKRHGHMTQHLGQKFKTEAHTRYHSLFPDQVPDLRTVEPAKCHTFLGYHTSVFRG